MQAPIAVANDVLVTQRVTGFMRLAREREFSAGIAETHTPTSSETVRSRRGMSTGVGMKKRPRTTR